MDCATSLLSLARLVSSTIRGMPFRMIPACTNHTRVESQVPIRESAAFSSGLPHTLAARRSVVVFPHEVLYAHSTTKLGAFRIINSGGDNEAYTPRSTRGYFAIERTPCFQSSNDP